MFILHPAALNRRATLVPSPHPCRTRPPAQRVRASTLDRRSLTEQQLSRLALMQSNDPGQGANLPIKSRHSS